MLAAARHLGLTSDPIVRQTLADLYAHHKLAQLTNRRAAAALKAGNPEAIGAQQGRTLNIPGGDSKGLSITPAAHTVPHTDFHIPAVSRHW